MNHIHRLHCQHDHQVAPELFFAADDALFLGSAFQYFSIPYDIHHRKAKEFLFQSKFIDAQQAKETLHILLKYQTDIAKAAKELSVDTPTR